MDQDAMTSKTTDTSPHAAELDVTAVPLDEFESRLFPAEQRIFTGWLRMAVRVACVGLTLMTLYFAFTATIGEIATRSLHLLFTVPLTLLLYPAWKSSKTASPSVFDVLLAIIGIVCFAWSFWSQDRYLDRYVGFDDIPTYDIVLGILALIVVFEAARRTVGIIIVGLNLFFIVYAVTGPYWPGLFEHRGVPLDELIETLYMDTSGLFNFITGIMATFLFTFLLLGAILRATGGDAVFTNLAMALAGHRRGGPAKVAVISSALMGMLSGSSISNVATTGAMTIPLMKRTGYKPHEAAAIEVVASVGGGLTPPLMGAGAFIMASLTGEPLAKILAYSIAPAALYYVAIYIFTDVKAAQRNLQGLPRESLPRLGDALFQGWHIIGAIALLITLLMMDFTPFFSAGACVVATLAVALMRATTRIGPAKIIATLESGTRVALSISALLASAAIIYGVTVQTGLLTKITSILLDFSGGSTFIAIVLIGLISYVVGMGMPVTASYVIIAALGATFLQDLGMSALAAHLIIFWFAQDSTITPPICMTAFVGARIANANPMRTGWECVKLAKALYVIPFVFAFGSLLDESIPEILFDVFALFICFAAMQLAITGYFRSDLAMPARLLLGAISLAALMATVGPAMDSLYWMGGTLAGSVLFMMISGRRQDATA
jgi:TRAP transporter 4TM/12TM fusion protein